MFQIQAVKHTNLFPLSFIFTAILFVTISGCSKKDATPTCTDGIQNGNETGVDCGAGSCFACQGALIKTERYTELGTQTLLTANYTYDDQKRVLQKVVTGGWYHVEVTVFTYSGNTVTAVYTGNSMTDTTAYTLDGQGYGVPVDAEGHPIEAGDVWENGNLVSAQVQVGGGATTTYTYTYSDKINTIGNENRGLFFLGKLSKNLASAVTYYGNTYPVEYTFDDQNRVIESNGVTYTYY